MRIGTQYEEVGSKYPFDESDPGVSNFPSTTIELGKVPCDLFSDVVIDCNDTKFELLLDGVENGQVKFKWSAGQGIEGEFFISGRNFNSFGRVLYVSSVGSIVQIETHLGKSFDSVVSSFSLAPDPGGWGEPVPVFPATGAKIKFDRRCYRLSEKRLLSLGVNGVRVSGDILFIPGYNTSLSVPMYGTDKNPNLLIDFSAGAGAGKAPCVSKEVYPGMKGLMPNANGDIRIETDGCYSIYPISNSELFISSSCTACCSCEGDYIPVAKALKQLILRSVNPSSPQGVYQRLVSVHNRYNSLIGDYAIMEENIAKQQLLNSSAILYRRQSPDDDLLAGYELALSFMYTNRAGEVITVQGFQIDISDNLGHTYSRRFDTAMSKNALKIESRRRIQCGSKIYEDDLAQIDPIHGPKSVNPGNTLYITTKFSDYLGHTVNRGDRAVYKSEWIYDAQEVKMTLEYRLLSNMGASRPDQYEVSVVPVVVNLA